jgi:predicted nucleic acid-binding Zn ribbon protein
MNNISITTKGKMNNKEAGMLGWLKTKVLHEAAFQKRIEDYNKIPKYCLKCNVAISYDKRFNKFCSQSCNAIYNNNKRGITTYEKKCLVCSNIIKDSRNNRKYCSVSCQAKEKNENVIKEWKEGRNKGYSGKTMLVPPWLRRYLFEKFNSKCCKCGWCEINPSTNKTPLEVNHIDGDASNAKESNLELICPNCHSLTPNYRALNKNSKRDRK